MENRTLTTAYLKEIEAENTATRKCLERIPGDVGDFKPHPKSMEMRYLVLLTAEIPTWVQYMIQDGEIDLATFKHFEAGTNEELLKNYDAGIEGAKKALESITDEDLQKEFKLKQNGELLMSQSLLEGIGSTINHWIHHRGQLTVYMRLNDIAVPSIYGPSADDRTF